MKKTAAVLSSMFAVILLACSAGSSSTTGDAGSEGGPTTPPAADASHDGSAGDGATTGDAGSGCTTLGNDAPQITSNNATGSPPPSSGGTIVDGTYFLTTKTNYNQSASGPSGTHKETMAIANGTMTIIKIGVTNPIDANVYNYSAAGSTLTTSCTCPKAKTEVFGFTATGATLTTVDSMSILRVYTRQ